MNDGPALTRPSVGHPTINGGFSRPVGVFAHFLFACVLFADVLHEIDCFDQHAGPAS
jgi:hypothetical protein